MQVRHVPPATLNAIAALLQPYAPEASPSAIVEALQAHCAPPPPDNGPALVSLREAGRRLSLSEWTVRRFVLAGKIPARRLGGQWRVPAAALAELAVVPELELSR